MYALPLLLLAMAHCLVDTFAMFAQPLWPDLKVNASLTDASVGYAFIVWSLATSLSQIVFGYWGDRHRGRWLIWAGPGIAVCCLACIGWAHSFWSLCLLLLVGGLGVGAFHPEAAALVGACSPENRSRAMSIFVLGGSIGQATGPVYAGFLTTEYGLPALAVSGLWGLAFVLLLLFAMPRMPAAPSTASGRTVSLGSAFRGKWLTAILVLVIGTLRVLPMLGTLFALSFLLKARGMEAFHIGVAQSVFQVSMGAGVLGCAVLVRTVHERRVLWLLPLFGVAPLLASATVGYGALLVCLTLGGLAFGGATPVLISYGQQLLPEGQRIASSLTMGASWGIGGAIVAVVMGVCNRAEEPEMAIYLFASAPVLSSALCYWLPRIDQAPASIEMPAQSARPTTA